MPIAPKIIHDACLSWLKTCERSELERATLKAYRSHANIHIIPQIGARCLPDLSRGQVRDFMRDMLEAGLSRTQVKKVMISLRSILSEAMEREWVEYNVATDVKLKRQSGVAGDGKVIPYQGRDPPDHRQGAGLASGDVHHRHLHWHADLRTARPKLGRRGI
ncbi:MAG: hypothetical protein ACU0A8_01440 [Limimaricola soesokkakensis]|uniref:hypothetical protein n=1 Tax=Limimaricola soesokkakensis TaxID=1343159 RepID=UPI0040596EBB